MLTLLPIKPFKASTLVAVDGFYTVSVAAGVVLTGSWEKKEYFHMAGIKYYNYFSKLIFSKTPSINHLKQLNQ